MRGAPGPVAGSLRPVDRSTNPLHRPVSVEELQELVAGSNRIRVLGSGRSSSPIAENTGDLVSVASLPPRVEVDAEARTATVAAGLRYGDIAPVLHAAGWALPNLPSLPDISVGGACVTGAHGSGHGNRVLAASAPAVELVRADGSLDTVRRGDPGFEASVLSLGAAGVVTGLTLDLVPTFDVAQWVLRDVPWDEFGALDDMLEFEGYSVSAFTFFDQPVFEQVWIKRVVGPDGAVEAPDPSRYGGYLADEPVHVLRGGAPSDGTEQLGSPGPWHERLPHFRAGYRPEAGAGIRSEYVFALAHADAALRTIASIRERFAPLLLVAEIRSIADDDLWLSPGYGGYPNVLALQLTWRPDAAAVAAALTDIEENAIGWCDVRPDWGGAFAMASNRVAWAYPRRHEAAALYRRHDPAGKFSNAMLERYLFTPGRE